MPIDWITLLGRVECPHRILFATVSGAHLYGFDSPDSDVDLRGCHVTSLDEYVGLRPPGETFERMCDVDGVEVDFVTHDIGKYLRLLLKCNGYVLEQVFSPIVADESAGFGRLREVARLCVCKQFHKHFFHFGTGQWQLVTGKKAGTIKGLLYTYRPLLAGIHLMQTGEIESNLVTLNEMYPVPGLDELVEKKRSSAELTEISAAELAEHESRIIGLKLRLDQARDFSKLPEMHDAFGAADSLLRDVRLGKVTVDS